MPSCLLEQITVLHVELLKGCPKRLEMVRERETFLLLSSHSQYPLDAQVKLPAGKRSFIRASPMQNEVGGARC